MIHEGHLPDARPRTFRFVVRIALLLALLLVIAGAYLRLHEAGMGCQGWPECYGRIGPPPPADGPGALARVANDFRAPLDRAASIHHLLSTALLLSLSLINVLAFRARQFRALSAAALTTAALLAVTGTHLHSLHHPVPVLANQLAGFCLLGLLGWLRFQLEPGAPRHTETRIGHMRGLVLGAIVALCIQVVLGGLTGVNFAGAACRSLPDCEDGWFPDATIYSAFTLTRAHEVDAAGLATGNFERVAIHRAHRLGSVLAVIFVLAAAVSAMFSISAMRGPAIFVMLLLAAELALGVLTVMDEPLLVAAIFHGALAGLILLGLLKILAVSRERLAPML